MKSGDLSEIAFHVGARLDHKDILLVDDISDTGKTFIRGTKYLQELGANSVTTASLFIKPWTKYIPDFYTKEVHDWVVFPFDIKETIDAINKKMLKEGKKTSQIQNKLEHIKIPKKYIKKFT